MPLPDAEYLRDANFAGITSALANIAARLDNIDATLRAIDYSLKTTNGILTLLHIVGGNATILIDRMLNTR